MCFRLEYEQSRLLNRMEELVSTFDAELRHPETSEIQAGHRHEEC